MRLNLIDVVVLGYCLLQIAYVGVLGFNIENQLQVMAIYSGCFSFSLICILLRLRFTNIVCRFLGNLYPLFLIGLFYMTAGYQVYMFFNYSFDDIIIKLENWIFGVHPTIWVQQYYHPALTEWMLFGYSIYLLLIPFTTIWLYATHRDKEWRHMLGSLLICLFISYIIFTLVPVVGPRVALADQYTVELKGFVFRSFTKLLEGGPMLDGGAFPSAHCAVASILFILTYRYNKILFKFLAPILITLIIATVYGRYHYVIDVVAGVLIGYFSIKIMGKVQSLRYGTSSIKKMRVLYKPARPKEKVSLPE